MFSSPLLSMKPDFQFPKVVGMRWRTCPPHFIDAFRSGIFSSLTVLKLMAPSIPYIAPPVAIIRSLFPFWVTHPHLIPRTFINCPCYNSWWFLYPANWSFHCLGFSLHFPLLSASLTLSLILMATPSRPHHYQQLHPLLAPGTQQFVGFIRLYNPLTLPPLHRSSAPDVFFTSLFTHLRFHGPSSWITSLHILSPICLSRAFNCSEINCSAFYTPAFTRSITAWEKTQPLLPILLCFLSIFIYVLLGNFHIILPLLKPLTTPPNPYSKLIILHLFFTEKTGEVRKDPFTHLKHHAHSRLHLHSCILNLPTLSHALHQIYCDY